MTNNSHIVELNHLTDYWKNRAEEVESQEMIQYWHITRGPLSTLTMTLDLASKGIMPGENYDTAIRASDTLFLYHTLLDQFPNFRESELTGDKPYFENIPIAGEGYVTACADNLMKEEPGEPPSRQ